MKKTGAAKIKDTKFSDLRHLTHLVKLNPVTLPQYSLQICHRHLAPYSSVISCLSLFMMASFFQKWKFKGPLKYLLMPLLGKNQLAITLHKYASI